jgi:energy-coupling factor transport system permease protein
LSASDLHSNAGARWQRRAARVPRRSCGRAGIWAGFIIALTLSVLAFGARTPALLAWLTAVDGLFLGVTRPGWKFLRRGAKALIWQASIITGLYCLRFGFSEGWAPGLTTAWQLYLAFLPGAVFVEVTPGHWIVRILADVMPYRMAFVMATCLNFIPLLLREVQSIYEGQILRGAKILPRDLTKPWNWPDVVHCLVVPAMVQSMSLAAEIALAARARDFGAMKHRTYWPGDPEKCNPDAAANSEME